MKTGTYRLGGTTIHINGPGDVLDIHVGPPRRPIKRRCPRCGRWSPVIDETRAWHQPIYAATIDEFTAVFPYGLGMTPGWLLAYRRVRCATCGVRRTRAEGTSG